MQLIEKVWKFETESPDYNLILSHLHSSVFFPNARSERDIINEQNFQVILRTCAQGVGGGRLKATALRDLEICSCVKVSNYLFEPDLEGTLVLPTQFYFISLETESGILS